MVRGKESRFEETITKLFAQQDYDFESGDSLNRNYSDVILEDRLVSSLRKINPEVGEKAIQRTKQKIVRPHSNELKNENSRQYENITEGVTVEESAKQSTTVYPVDFEEPENNEFLVVNQLKVRFRDNVILTPDIVVFLNGIPIAVLELKGNKSSSESLQKAYEQVQRYKDEIPNLFFYVQFIGVLNRSNARVGSITASWDWMLPWKYIEEEPEDKSKYETVPKYELLVRGMFEKQRLIDIIHNFILHSSDGSKVTPAYYQYYGVKNAVNSTLDKMSKDSKRNPESRKLGIFSHSQGSGKSLSIAYYIKQIKRREPGTLFVILTDTNDLDKQIHKETLLSYGFDSKQIDNIDDLREELRQYKEGGGGILTTTIQKFQAPPSQRAHRRLNEEKRNFNHTKFSEKQISESDIRNKVLEAQRKIENRSYMEAIHVLDNITDETGGSEEITVEKPFSVDESKLSNFEHPVLNERNDIVVISDEAHRSQDASLGVNVRAALPNASQIGFTATPKYELDENITAKWFGDVISSYRIDQAEEDGSVVKIDYENRAPEVTIEEEKLKEVYEQEDIEEVEGVKTEDIVKHPERQQKIAKDVVHQFNKRELEGCALFVVYDRETAVEYKRIIEGLQEEYEGIDSVPETHAVISSPEDFGLTSDDNLKKRFKDVEDDFKLAIVCDKWTTGFNVEQMHTIYLDKPIKDHNLVQTLGRVNRTHEGKDAGKVVDYIGFEDSVKSAFSKYSTKGRKSIQVTQEEVEEKFNRKFNSITNKVDIPSDISEMTDWKLDQYVEQAMVTLEKSGERQKFIDEFDELESLYRRVHPSKSTEDKISEVRFLARVSSRIKKSKQEYQAGTTSDGEIDQLIEQAIESEEAVQIDMVEGEELIENISNPEIDIDRAKQGIQRKMERQETYSLKTYEEVKRSIEEAVKRYNSRRISSDRAIEILNKELDRVESEERRADDLGLNNKQLSIYDELVTSTNLDESEAVAVVQEIDEAISETAENPGWKNRKDILEELKLDIFNILRSDKYAISDIQFEDATDIVETAVRVY